MNDKLFIVIPCYNEEAVLPVSGPMFLEELTDLIQKRKISDESRILLIDNGSVDNTWNIIQGFIKSDPHFLGLSLSRNFTHQGGVLAGLMETRDMADISISIDADGQDDVKAMEGMVDAYHQGYDIVYGVRSNRDTDTAFKRNTAQWFYKLLQGMGVDVVYNHADYRLTSKRVLQEFSSFHEVNLFLRGMFPLVGFKSTSVYYKRHERMAGESHYPLSRLLQLAFDGITSLSIKPIRMITGLGVVIALLSFIGALWVFISWMLGKGTVRGWSSTILSLFFLGGVQLISLGIIGEYIGKIYMEVKQRPRYIVRARSWDETAGDYLSAGVSGEARGETTVQEPDGAAQDRQPSGKQKAAAAGSGTSVEPGGTAAQNQAGSEK